MVDKNKDLTAYVQALMDKDTRDTEVSQTKPEVSDESSNSSATLKRIGNLIVSRNAIGKKSKNAIGDLTKDAYDKAVDFIDSHEDMMKESNEDQQVLFSQVKEALIDVRMSKTLEELEGRRRNLDSMKDINEGIPTDIDNRGEQSAKTFIAELTNKLHEDLKPKKSQIAGVALKQTASKLFGGEGTVVNAIGKELKQWADVFKIPMLSKDKGTEPYDKEIGRLTGRATSIEPAKTETKPTKAKSSSWRDYDPGDKENVVPKAVDPGIVNKKSSVGDTTVDPTGKMYEKTGTGWKDLDTGKVVQRHKQSAIEGLFGQQTSGVSSGAGAASKISTLTVDKIVAKSITVEPTKKDAPKASVENKPFSTALLGEDEKKEPGLLDKAKGLFGGVGSGLVRGAGAVLRNPIGATVAAGATMLGAGAALDTGLGALGVGKDEKGQDLQLDAKKDDENWNKMSMWEKVQSGAARGIEKAGRFVFLDNMANQAASERIAKESTYLKDRVDTKPTMIDQASQEIPKATERVNQLGQDQTNQLGRLEDAIRRHTAGNAPGVEQTPTVVPIKGSVRSNESSFNRFQDRNAKG